MVMKKKRIVSIVVMIIGLVTLVIGVVFLVLSLTVKPAVPDGEYLVSVKEWVMDSGCPEATSECEGASVRWKFTEIGKGTLTTNNHLNDYDFAWALENGQLLVRTDWLYELNDSFAYKLDQAAGELVLTNGDKEYRFVAQQE